MLHSHAVIAARTIGLFLLPTQVVLCAALAGHANAQPTEQQQQVTLTTTLPPECPDEISLRAGVISRLGYDPFVTTSATSVAVVVDKSAAGYRGTSTVRTATQPSAVRTIPQVARCEDLVAALSVSLALVIDPVAANRTAAADAAPAAPVGSAAPPVLMPEPPSLGRDRPPHLVEPQAAPTSASEISAFVGARIVGLPNTSVNFGVAAARHWHAWRFAFEATFVVNDAKFEKDTDSSSILVEFIARGCRQWGPFETCGLVGGGQQSNTVTVSSIDPNNPYITLEDVTEASVFQGVVGIGVGLNVPLGDSVFVRPTVDLLVPLLPLDIRTRSETLYSPPFVSIAAVFAVGTRW